MRSIHGFHTNSLQKFNSKIFLSKCKGVDFAIVTSHVASTKTSFLS